MDKRLTIISYPHKRQAYFDVISFGANSDDFHYFARCQHGIELNECILNFGRDATLIDLVGHGSESHFDLGDDTPFLKVGRNPPKYLCTLKNQLSGTARIRLIGCYTGINKGLSLLKSLSCVIGREVLGTRILLESHHFGPEGLLRDISNQWFVSSSSETEQSALLLPSTHPVPIIDPRWKSIIPDGYELVGRANPIAKKDFSFHYEEMIVSFACEFRVILIEDTPQSPPVVFCWSRSGPVPLIDKIIRSFNDQ